VGLQMLLFCLDSVLFLYKRAANTKQQWPTVELWD